MIQWNNAELLALRFEDGQARWLPYAYVDGAWRLEDGHVLEKSDPVYVRCNGAFVMAVNPVTREATALKQVFMVTKVDGEDVGLSPSRAVHERKRG